MAIRTTNAAVMEINPDIPAAAATTGTPAYTALTAYIEAANQMVDDNCLESDYSSDKLELIERWLSAHFYDCGNRVSSQESIGSGAVSETKNRMAVDLQLDNSTYGQMVKMLDNAGNLASLNNIVKDVKLLGNTHVVWIGSNPLEETGYY